MAACSAVPVAILRDAVLRTAPQDEVGDFCDCEFQRPGPSLPRLEISQVRRRLILQGWHQVAICTEEIVFFADDDVTVVLGAVVFEPDDVTVAAIALVHGPRTRQRMVDRRYVVA